MHQQDPVAVVTEEILWEEEQENGLEISITTVTLLSSALGQAQYLLKAGGIFKGLALHIAVKIKFRLAH